MKIPRIIISAASSGSGKTLITIALIKALVMEGKKVCAFKTGPDYIDPLFHKKILGVPSRNLDLFFSDEQQVKSIFCGGSSGDISVIEGVMGFYDGLSPATDTASTYHMAKTLKVPVVLVVDTKGMANSVLALIKGFVSMDRKKTIKAVILNNTSKNVYEALKPEIEKRFGIAVLGYFPKQKDIVIQSRYLGLLLPDEINDIQKMAEKAALELCKTVDIKKIISIADKAPDLSFKKEKAFWLFKNEPYPEGGKVKIAVARDKAFCFYYEDNLKLIEYYGGELVEFSPLEDSLLPQGVCGLVLGGGYPELFAEALEKNEGLRSQILQKIKEGLPCVSECGGFMYLHDSVTDQDGKKYRMVGAVKGYAFFAGKLVRFGYGSFTEKNNFFTGGKPVRGHEFHYFDSSSNGSDVRAEKPVSKKSWDCVHVSETEWAGFPHLYYPSNPEFARNFVEKCRRYKAEK